MTTHGYALNVDLDPAPFTEWITACGLEDAAFTTIARELGRPLTVDEVRQRRGQRLSRVARCVRLEPRRSPSSQALRPTESVKASQSTTGPHGDGQLAVD